MQTRCGHKRVVALLSEGVPGTSADAAGLAPLVARLRAQLATLPVIEQAKGILMGREHCSPEEAFDMLRRASQRTNVPVRDLALELVAAVTEPRRRSS